MRKNQKIEAAMSETQIDKDEAEEIKKKLDKLRCDALKGRVHETEDSRRRSNLQRDYARVLYSTAFRRLQGKMQLFGIDNVSFYRNRLTHSLEVSQVASGICNQLERRYYPKNKGGKREFWNFDEIYLINAISLAHDLGNPPFGHAGEKVLNELAQKFGGFEGNAQTYRIVTKIEERYAGLRGLNLTKRTLLGLAKHFYKRSSKKSKFLYNEDYKELTSFIKEAGLNMKPGQQTLDCAVMDLADEIAYAAHDLEDALQLKYINADELLYLFEREAETPKYLEEYCKDGNKSEIKRAHKKLKKLIETAREKAKTAKGPSDDVFDSIFRKELSAEIVDTLIKDIKYIAEKDTLGFEKHKVLCKGLKTLLFNAIKNDSRMILCYEKQGKIVLEGLYEVFSDKEFNKDNCLLPSAYQQYENEPERKRMIIDYIAGMQESFAIEQYEKYFGADSLDKVYRKRE